VPHLRARPGHPREPGAGQRRPFSISATAPLTRGASAHVTTRTLTQTGRLPRAGPYAELGTGNWPRAGSAMRLVSRAGQSAAQRPPGRIAGHGRNESPHPAAMRLRPGLPAGARRRLRRAGGLRPLAPHLTRDPSTTPPATGTGTDTRGQRRPAARSPQRPVLLAGVTGLPAPRTGSRIRFASRCGWSRERTRPWSVVAVADIEKGRRCRCLARAGGRGASAAPAPPGFPAVVLAPPGTTAMTT
jgi:hypothetical protein